MPGFLLNRVRLLLLGAGPLRVLGIALVAFGAVLHVTASSGVRAVKPSVRLRPADDTAAPSSHGEDVPAPAQGLPSG